MQPQSEESQSRRLGRGRKLQRRPREVRGVVSSRPALTSEAAHAGVAAGTRGNVSEERAPQPSEPPPGLLDIGGRERTFLRGNLGEAHGPV